MSDSEIERKRAMNRIKQSEWRAKNLEKARAIGRAKQAANREKYNAVSRAWHAVNKDTRTREDADIRKRRKAVAIATLPNWYVANKMGFSVADVPIGLIEVQRVVIQIKRKLKELK